ncbi:hypothetical protein BU17DRAFT_83291 [Hysterangium stoloniferum]|nr:hypothetical protein BU17DRAFT_83291 [Hysterangium stoloniferum]
MPATQDTQMDVDLPPQQLQSYSDFEDSALVAGPRHDIIQAAAEIFPENFLASSPFSFIASQNPNEGGTNGTNEAASPPAARDSTLTFETAQMSLTRGESGSYLNDIPQSPKPENVKELTHERYPSYPSATPSTTINNYSSKGARQRRPHRTESERIQDFREDPQVADVEPYRVLSCCGKARLNPNRSRSQSSVTVPAPSTPIKVQDVEGDIADTTETERGDGSQQNEHEDVASTTFPHVSKMDPAVPPPNMHPSLQLNMVALPPTIQSGPSIVDEPPKKKRIRGSGSTPKGARRARLMDAEQRRAVLEADPYTDTVEPDRILCSLCKRWVKLRPNSTYCAAPWQSHIGRCIQKFEKEPLPSLRNGVKHLPADSEDGHVPNGSTPDHGLPAMPRGQYYRQIPEEQTELQASNNEPLAASSTVRSTSINIDFSSRSYYKPEKPASDDPAEASNNEPSRSYYKPERPASDNPAVLSAAYTPKKPRGRPPKQAVTQEPPITESVSESDESYESEEP